MKDINLVIANNIKALRKANKLTQSELAEKINYSNKAVSRWESGEVIPDIITLNSICELFNIPLSKMFEEKLEKEKIKRSYKLKIGNKLAVSLLAVLLVWFLAIIAYVTILGTLNNSYWQLFIFAVPVSCIVGIIFSSIWGKARITFMLITTLIWSTLTSIYLIFVNENLWFIFLIGIPLQIGTLLWANISSNIKDKKSQTKEDNT
ncbi:MAG: helix-turn-helix transcriptional regulator [Clostridiales bacterium]|nr:helix-turn-helix transcriptional regulator [Clostridiales bacterium]